MSKQIPLLKDGDHSKVLGWVEFKNDGDFVAYMNSGEKQYGKMYFGSVESIGPCNGIVLNTKTTGEFLELPKGASFIPNKPADKEPTPKTVGELRLDYQYTFRLKRCRSLYYSPAHGLCIHLNRLKRVLCVNVKTGIARELPFATKIFDVRKVKQLRRAERR